MGEGHHTDHVVGPLGLEGDLGDDSPAGRVNLVPNIGLAEVGQVVARLCHYHCHWPPVGPRRVAGHRLADTCGH